MTRKQLAGPIDRAAGERLRKIRSLRGVTQEVLGKRIGVTFQQIQKYEKGTNRMAISTVVTISKALQCHPMDLIGEDEDTPERMLSATLTERNADLSRRLADIAELARTGSANTGLHA